MFKNTKNQRCIVCAELLVCVLVDENGQPLSRMATSFYLREKSLEKRQLKCAFCFQTCFANERERISILRQGRCSDCGGNHMRGPMESEWLFRAKLSLRCQDHD